MIRLRPRVSENSENAMKPDYLLILGTLMTAAFWSATSAATITVGGTNTIYGAGLLTAPDGGSLPPFMTVTARPGQTVLFTSVTGQVTSGFAFGPDGEGAATFATAMDNYAGLSGIRADRAFFLAGVFLSDSVPQEPAPPTLDFRPTGLGRDFEGLSPLIGQTFFIGDGRVGEGGHGTLQAFAIPATATRLFLGIADGQFDGAAVFGQPGNYSDNGGAFTVGIVLRDDACPAELSIHVSQVDICWASCTNRMYQVQYRSSSTTNAWANLGLPVRGEGATNCLSDRVDPAQAPRIYQVLTLPQ